MFVSQSRISVHVVDTAHFHQETLDSEVMAVFSKALQELRGGVIPVQAVAERYAASKVSKTHTFSGDNLNMMDLLLSFHFLIILLFYLLFYFYHLQPAPRVLEPSLGSGLGVPFSSVLRGYVAEAPVPYKQVE